MRVYLDNIEATIKKGSSFEYISENRLFSGADNYTLSITLPLKDCEQNLKIFGNINRKDVPMQDRTFDCELRDVNFFKRGVATIVDVSDTEVKIQMLTDRSALNFKNTFSDIYIDTLNLGKPNVVDASRIEPLQAWNSTTEVAIPWVNEAYPLVPNNWVTHNGFNEDGTDKGYAWHKDVKKLSFMPYLYVITERICQELGYTYDFTDWRQSRFRYIVICNVLPAEWETPEYNKIMPHWTVEEYFDKLEKFMCAEFDVDHAARHITMRFSSETVTSLNDVKIDKVIDDFSVEIAKDEDQRVDYVGCKRWAYKAGSNPIWNYWSCDWFIDKMQEDQIARYDTLKQLIAACGEKKVYAHDSSGKNIFTINIYYGDDSLDRGMYGGKYYVMYAADVDTYFCLRSVGAVKLQSNPFLKRDRYYQRMVLQPINIFGSGCPESDNSDTEELEFIPVSIDDTYISDDDNMGLMMMLSFSADNTDATDEDNVTEVKPWEDEEFPGMVQSGISAQIEAGEDSSEGGYFDVINVGYWYYYDSNLGTGRNPLPAVDLITVYDDWGWKSNNINMRINRPGYSYLNSIPQIETKNKYKFSWIGDTIPNPRAIFNICGKKYVCEKITANFSENGMSQLLKGEFYAIKE